jgi:AcrR family transcriptional regulator
MEQKGNKIREPKQKRSINLKQNILEKAIKIFSEKGYYNTSTHEISRAAGTSVGSFYSYFKDKKQLFMEVIKYLDEQIDEKMKIENISFGEDKEQYIHSLLNNILFAHKMYPKFHKELNGMQLLDTDINRIYEELEKKTLDSYYKGLQSLREQLKVENLEAASFIIYKTVDNVIHDIVNNKTEIEEVVLIKELTSMISGYLFH